MALSRLAALVSPLANDSEKNASTENRQPGEGEMGWGRSVLARVRALSVSGQQHGTVFWKAGAKERLESLGKLGPKDTLVEVRQQDGRIVAPRVTFLFFLLFIMRSFLCCHVRPML